MRQIEAIKVLSLVKKLCLKANFNLREDVLQALDKAQSIEQSETGREILKQLIENARIAREESIPICQDTGFVTVFMEIGQEVSVIGGSLGEAVERGVRQAYKEGYLRPSVVSDPCFSRTNTKDNTPPLTYVSIVSGEGFKITVMPKGGGSENASQLRMMSLVGGVEGVKEFVLRVVREAGPNACPPMVAGIGVGGTFDSVALLAKRALLRPLHERHPAAELANLERELFAKINDLGFGPGGLGGIVTALSVNIETFPTHMACLPVAVNLSCHALRSAEGVL